MAELVDAQDSKSCSGNRVGVRFSPPVPNLEGFMDFRLCNKTGPNQVGLGPTAVPSAILPSKIPFMVLDNG